MKKTLTIILIIIITLLAGVPNYAINETTNNLQKTTNTGGSTKKSNNTILTSLGIKPYDFTGFKNAQTSYDVEVPESIQSVEVYATTQDKNATLEGTGTKKLEKGKNVVEVTVVAEDGTRKTFTINIIRGEDAESDEQQKSEENPIESNQNVDMQDENNDSDSEYKKDGLQSIDIEKVNIQPQFNTNIYEYTGKYIGEESQLKIEAKPTNDNYTVEIIGNNNLKEGENIITILVSESNGTNIATYQILINKSLVDEEEIAKQKELEKNRQQEAKQRTIFIILGAVGAIIIVFAIYMIIKNKREDELFDEDYSETSSYGDDYEDNEEEIPKALKNKKTNYNEKLTKEQAKEKFLNNYTNNQEKNYKDKEKNRKNNSKGKRFKE